MLQAILCDIEGTMSSIAFVKERLFPYAAEKLPAFVNEHKQDPQVKRLLQSVAAEIGDDRIQSIIDTLLSWIRQDRKSTSLKSLQGLIWSEGYANGQLKGHVYEDAVHQLKAWHAAGLHLYIYSSGSTQAQQLLFKHTDFGDLTYLFDGYFDTRIGQKSEALSYQNIADSLRLPAENILFLSDMQPELDAAQQAGMQTYHLLRDNKSPHTTSHHPQATDFEQITLKHADIKSTCC